jgi:hypothetical protein
VTGGQPWGQPWGQPSYPLGIHDDETCTKGCEHIVCSNIEAAVFTDDPKAGSATVVAIDQDDSYATAAVTVIDDGVDASLHPLRAVPCGQDDGQGNRSLDDSGAGAIVDAQEGEQERDASVEAKQPSPSSSGYSCAAARVDGRGIAGGRLGSALLALVFARRFFNHPHRRPRGHPPRSRNSNKLSSWPRPPRSRTGTGRSGPHGK